MGHGQLIFISDLHNLKSPADGENTRYVNDPAAYKRELLGEIGYEPRQPRLKRITKPLPGRERAPLDNNPWHAPSREQGEFRKGLADARARALEVKEAARRVVAQRKIDKTIAKIEAEERKLEAEEKLVVSEYADRMRYDLTRDPEGVERECKQGATNRVRRLIMQHKLKPTFKRHPTVKLLDVLSGTKTEFAYVACQCTECDTFFPRQWRTWAQLTACPKCTRGNVSNALKAAKARAENTRQRTALWAVSQLGG